MRRLRKQHISIPVIVDSVKGEGSEDLIRCTYFSIECTRPSPGWGLDLDERLRVPFIMLGLQGVVYKPLGRTKLFSSSAKIDDFFDLVDGSEDFFVDTNEVWFRVSDMPKASRGMIFRVSFNLFTYGLKLASLDKPEASEVTAMKEAWYSSTEHKAFSTWARKQVEEARDNFKEMSSQGLDLKRISKEDKDG